MWLLGSGNLVASLANFVGTSLGFAVVGFTPWGGTATITQPQQAKACIIGTVLHRRFKVTVGRLIDPGYRNGIQVKMDANNNIFDSNEKNASKVRVMTPETPRRNR